VTEWHPRVVAATLRQLSAREEALRRGARHVGWKIGVDFPEIEAVIGEQSVVGHLTSETVLASGARFSLSGVRAPRVETELVIEVGTTGIAGVAVGLEIVDVARPPGDLERIIAANVAHKACVIGAMESTSSLPSGVARMWVNGELRESAPLPGSISRRLSAAADVLAAVGLRLQPGDRLLAGSLTHVRCAPGDHVVAEIDTLGFVDAFLVE
jgi:2-keto-4-pentenoate hydratase